MACTDTCKLCKNLIISTAVTFTAGTGLVITIPEGSYGNGCKYCIVIAQAIPEETTITAPVFIQIGEESVLYPLNSCKCTQILACLVRTRTRYATKVSTTATGGSFNLLRRAGCGQNNSLAAIDGTT